MATDGVDCFDLIVVGAGPGGSNAAAVALKGGLRVAQVDRARFPRLKPCAGGLTMKSCRALRLAYEPWIRGTWSAVEFNLWGAQGNRFRNLERPVVRMVSRPEFDNALVEQNLRAPSFRLFSGERALDASHDGEFSVRTAVRTLRAPQLVAADGAYSTINRLFGLAEPKATAVAIEVDILRERATVDGELTTCFDLGAVPEGYGWIFPKDGRISAGLYTYRKGLKDLRPRLRRYIAAKGITLATDEPVRFDAHQVPVGGYRLREPDVPLYVVGDAGGFADALTGEGIYHALESGRIAGETAVAVHRGQASPSRTGYRRRLWRSVLPDTFLTYQAATRFYRHLGAGTRLLALPPVWRVLIEGYSDSATMAGSARHGARYLARSLLHHNLARESSPTRVSAA